MRNADWRSASDKFGAALAVSDSPEGREGLALACFWQGDAPRALQAQETAYRLYQQRGDRRSAARVATWLALEYAMGRGQSAVANGWLQRAHRLLAGVVPSQELAWLLFWEAHILLLYSGDLAKARARLTEALALARDAGIRDVETMAVGLEGVMLVNEGTLAEGMRRRDEIGTAASSSRLADDSLSSGLEKFGLERWRGNRLHLHRAIALHCTGHEHPWRERDERERSKQQFHGVRPPRTLDRFDFAGSPIAAGRFTMRAIFRHRALARRQWHR